MLVRPDERRPLAELLRFLELGERLAHHCAAAQARLAPTPKMRRFLTSQARQEAFHATVFSQAALWIDPRHHTHAEPYTPLTEYERLILNALDRNDFLETIVAEQVILESLGEAILLKLEAGLKKRGAPFQRLCNVLLHQEEAHHGFGTRVLDQAITDGTTDHDELRHKAEPYLLLTNSLVLTLQSRFDDIDEDPNEYLATQQQLLPKWLHTPVS